VVRLCATSNRHRGGISSGWVLWQFFLGARKTSEAVWSLIEDRNRRDLVERVTVENSFSRGLASVAINC